MNAVMSAIRTVEILSFKPESPRGLRMFDALTQAAPNGIEVQHSTIYHGDADLLMLWGPGALDRFEPMRLQCAMGGHVAAFDLPYWHRDEKLRISIDAAHPRQWVMRRDWPQDRVQADKIIVREAWDPSGPILVAGIGPKSRVQYGADIVDAWEAHQIAAARRFGRPIYYRRKRGLGTMPAGCALASETAPIEDVLAGASLLITWHSNVAVDAIRLGIPVVCWDGAAAAVCSSVIPDQPTPLSLELRDRFLANLAFFQWAPSEAKSCWAWLQELLA